MLRNFIVIVFVLVLFVHFSGCNGHVGLSGRVTYSDNDAPLEAGTVCLVKDSFSARGRIKEDGKYVMGSFSTQDGLPPGTYNVYLLMADRTETGNNGEEVVTSLIDKKYRDAHTSGLTVEVTAKTHTFDFKVDRAP